MSFTVTVTRARRAGGQCLGLRVDCLRVGPGPGGAAQPETRDSVTVPARRATVTQADAGNSGLNRHDARAVVPR